LKFFQDVSSAIPGANALTSAVQDPVGTATAAIPGAAGLVDTATTSIADPTEPVFQLAIPLFTEEA